MSDILDKPRSYALMWLDEPDKKLPFERRMESAVRKYEQRYGMPPKVLFVAEGTAEKTLENFLGMEVLISTCLPTNHVVLCQVPADYMVQKGTEHE